MNDSIVHYYDAFDEWARLDTDGGRIEFERTLAVIDGYLTERSAILDLGGGPGRYTLAMAEQGHICQLIDLSPRLIDDAHARISKSPLADRMPLPLVGSATDLSSLKDNSFDCVLALGPFYHLTQTEGRRAAASECLRVLRPKGVLIAAFIPRISGVVGLIDRASQAPTQVNAPVFCEAAKSGVFENPSDSGFQSGYYMQADEAVALLSDTGFRDIETLSIKSILYGREDAYAAIKRDTPDLAGEIYAFADETASNPAVVATCGHALMVGRKPTQ